MGCWRLFEIYWDLGCVLEHVGRHKEVGSELVRAQT